MPRPFLPILPAAILLTACQAVPTDPSEFAFMGSWDCGVTVMTFLPDGYMPSNDDPPIPVTQYRRLTGGGTEITLAGGNRIVVQGVTDTAMNWLSLQTGDSFDCTRVAG